jgi:hypothetical protein
MYWTGGWAGSRPSLDGAEKRKISYICRQSKHDFAFFQCLNICTEWGMPGWTANTDTFSDYRNQKEILYEYEGLKRKSYVGRPI